MKNVILDDIAGVKVIRKSRCLRDLTIPCDDSCQFFSIEYEGLPNEIIVLSCNGWHVHLKTI